MRTKKQDDPQLDGWVRSQRDDLVGKVVRVRQRGGSTSVGLVVAIEHHSFVFSDGLRKGAMKEFSGLRLKNDPSHLYRREFIEAIEVVEDRIVSDTE